MEKHDKASSISWFLFGGFIIYSAFNLDIGSLGDPGPGFFPLVSGCGLCLVSAMVYLQALLSKEKKTETIFGGVIWHRPAVILVAVFLYIYFFRRLGFILDNFLLLVVLFKAIEPQRWSVAILSSALVSLVTWAFFTYWLECQFPAGVLRLIGM
jgi:putative tricarboxylic transport membrane protein